MSLIGETFDGQYYDELEDYFLIRWGPDAQNLGAAAYWGILVNDVFTAVGGCQYPLDGGDEVLWIYDAFKGRPTLALFPESPAYSSGSRPPTAEATLNRPFGVEVVSYADDEENKPPASPRRTGSSGLAGVIRSNRLDVCVPGGGGAPLEGAVDCSELPKADQAQTPDPTAGEIEEPRRKRPPQQPEGDQGQTPGPPVVAEAIRLTTPRLDRRKIGQGRVGVSWRVLDPGPGVKSWAIASRTLGPQRGSLRDQGQRRPGHLGDAPPAERALLPAAVHDHRPPRAQFHCRPRQSHGPGCAPPLSLGH